MDNLETLSTTQLVALAEQAMSVQRRHPQSSDEWQTASVVINAVAPILAAREVAA